MTSHRKSQGRGGPFRCAICYKGFSQPRFRDLHQKLAICCHYQQQQTASTIISKRQVTGHFHDGLVPTLNGSTNSSTSNNAESQQEMSVVATIRHLRNQLHNAVALTDGIAAIRKKRASRYDTVLNDQRTVLIDFDLLLILVELYFLWPFGVALRAYYLLKIAGRLWLNKKSISFKYSTMPK